MTHRIHFIHAENPSAVAYDTFGMKPVWAYTLASYLVSEPDLDVELFDSRFCALDSVPYAPVFLFSGIDRNYQAIRGAADLLKSRYPSARYLLGGPIVWSFDQAGELDLLRGFDSLVIGDGEAVVLELVRQALRGDPLPAVLRVRDRFPLSQARPMHLPFMLKHVREIHGAVIEVSRGCPFLCEFCDIRIKPDNNRTHTKPAEIVVHEMDLLFRVGVRSFTFSCDNFIGELHWARDLVDRILEWQERTHASCTIITWTTVNLYKDERLMQRMRKAGFIILFIGVESFSQNSLLETAKVQNSTRVELTEALRIIHAHGFIVTAGLIVGFDSDRSDVFDLTLRGIEESCLLSIYVNFLEALPGTPLYRRMKLAGRLRSHELSDVRIQSKIRYLLDRSFLIEGYISFARQFSSGTRQYRRFAAFMRNLERGQYVVASASGTGNLRGLLSALLRNASATTKLVRQFWIFSADPRRPFYALRAFLLAASRARRVPGAIGFFLVWLSDWSRFVMANTGLSAADFDIESIRGAVTPQMILPEGYAETADEPIPESKIRAQIRNTVAQLQILTSESSRNTAEGRR
jgi:radical SAM superfamily enzyme YgiQ (UPF0313 family)